MVLQISIQLPASTQHLKLECNNNNTQNIRFKLFKGLLRNQFCKEYVLMYKGCKKREENGLTRFQVQRLEPLILQY